MVNLKFISHFYQFFWSISQWFWKWMKSWLAWWCSSTQTLTSRLYDSMIKLLDERSRPFSSSSLIVQLILLDFHDSSSWLITRENSWLLFNFQILPLELLKWWLLFDLSLHFFKPSLAMFSILLHIILDLIADWVYWTTQVVS